MISRLIVWLGLALLALPALRLGAEESVNDRLAKLEKLLEQQQSEIERRDARIKRLEEDARKDKADPVQQIENKNFYYQADKPAVKTDDAWKVGWSNGLKFSSADKNFEVTLGGRIMIDYVSQWEDEETSTRGTHSATNSTTPSAGLEFNDGVEFRRVRLAAAGTMYKHVFWKAEFDFAEGGDDQGEFTDVELGLKKLPWIGTWRVGRFKAPMSLEELTSSRHVLFNERSMVNNLAPGRETGTMLNNSHLDDRLTWALSVSMPGVVGSGNPVETTHDGNTGFTNSNTNGKANWAMTGRVTGTPWFEDKGRKLVHLGLSGRYHSLPDESDSVRFRARPGNNHIAERIIDTRSQIREDINGTDDLNGTSLWYFGAEVGFNYESFHFSGEYFHVGLNGDDVDREGTPDNNDQFGFEDIGIDAAYAQAAYFITGEHYSYKSSGGTFDRVKPKRNFLDGNGGLGAFMVAVRWHWIDMNDDGAPLPLVSTADLVALGLVPAGAFPREGLDADVEGGEQWGVTVGLNWYLNPNTAIKINWDHTQWERDDLLARTPGGTVPAGGEPRDYVDDEGSFDTFSIRFQVDF